MVSVGDNLFGSQFFITLDDELDYLVGALSLVAIIACLWDKKPTANYFGYLGRWLGPMTFYNACLETAILGTTQRKKIEPR